MSRDKCSTSPPLVVVAVHGTFARKASFAVREGPLMSELRKLITTPLLIEEHRWSGRNSVAARSTAACALVKTLKELHAKHRAPNFILIGHSHGGNVAALAASQLPRQIRVLGIVFMATPFLTAERRSFDPFVDNVGTGAAIIVCLGALLLMLFIWGVGESGIARANVFGQPVSE